MGNKDENGRVDAMEQIGQKLTDVIHFAKENKIKIVLLCVYEGKENVGTAFCIGGMSRNKAFNHLANAIANEFAETIQEEI